VSNLPKEPARPWRLIADEITHANRGDRIVELAEELERAFQEQMPVVRKSPQVVLSKNGTKQEIDPQQPRQS
jgi:hypothetical protein